MHYRRHPGNMSRDELGQDWSGVQILQKMLRESPAAQQHADRLRSEIHTRTLECAARAFYENRLDLFRQYLELIPLHRRPPMLHAKYLLSQTPGIYEAMRRAKAGLRSST